ncbi:uncharacterized protein LOC106080772 [Stomoxys calcitrans]|uniref:uncharacterized protein LOC106080772 n=1 Tax=Stomoxys calcitrans TaxID=35570 RepID=UPI0027E2AB69|nr:uncharacterized protein LOC106080772 [Stomoxys calcitrans]XP_013097758.2 uncharacterized protein LOC106080772 [Stomoxys calcitrans]XP_013097759.2 uncharacterized protein LOC106080772 [Stomoxys calcitrans]
MADSNEDETNEIPSKVMASVNTLLDLKFGNKNYTYKIELVGKKGDNYMGIVYRIDVCATNLEKRNMKLILKVPPQNPLRRNQFFARPGFLREALAYDHFLPLAYEFQTAKDLKACSIFCEYPKCHFTMTEEFNEAICMNDLQETGYYMHDRFEALTYEHVALVMVIYGKLHATSLAMKDQTPEKLTTLKQIVDIFVQRKDDPQLNDYFESLKKSALGSLDRKRDSDYWCKLTSYFQQGTFYELMLKLLHVNGSEPYAVVCHGDCWINNILFKYENGKVADACLLDWQIMRYGSPIIDLMYFLMSCTTQEFRHQHFNEMINIYHTSAAEHITKLGSDPKVLYPRQELEKQLKTKGAIGLLFAMIVLPILTTKSEDVPDLEELSEKVSAGKSTDAMEAGFVGAKSAIFNERMRGIICDTIDWGLI